MFINKFSLIFPGIVVGDVFCLPLFFTIMSFSSLFYYLRFFASIWFGPVGNFCGKICRPKLISFLKMVFCNFPRKLGTKSQHFLLGESSNFFIQFSQQYSFITNHKSAGFLFLFRSRFFIKKKTEKKTIFSFWFCGNFPRKNYNSEKIITIKNNFPFAK